MKLNTLEDLLHHELKDIYSAETQLVEALPKMADAATNEDLKAGFTAHLEQTAGHVERLDQIAELLELDLSGHTCKAMEGLIEEGADLIEEDADPAVRDAALISAARRVEHYEMSAYGTVAALAARLGHDEVETLARATLEEEEETEAKLVDLAESEVNDEAEEAADTANR